MAAAAVHSQRRSFHNYPGHHEENSGGVFSVICVGEKHLGLVYRIGQKSAYEICARRSLQAGSRKREVDRHTRNTPGQDRNSGTRSFVGLLLAKALGAFLKSQLEDFGELNVTVRGSNWELLSGKVREVQVSASKAVYKGISLTNVDLAASQVLIQLRGRRLVQKPFYVKASIRVQEQDLNASLASPLFSTSLQQIFPDKSPTLNVRMQDGTFHVTSPGSLYRHGIEFPIILRVEVEKDGETVLVDSLKDRSIQKSFKMGPEVRITRFLVDDSCIALNLKVLVGGKIQKP